MSRANEIAIFVFIRKKIKKRFVTKTVLVKLFLVKIVLDEKNIRYKIV